MSTRTVPPFFKCTNPFWLWKNCVGVSRVAFPPCASRQSSNAPRHREHKRHPSLPRRFHLGFVAIARRAVVETPTLDINDRFPRCPRPRRRVSSRAFRPRRTPTKGTHLLRLGNLIAHLRVSVDARERWNGADPRAGQKLHQTGRTRAVAVRKTQMYYKTRLHQQHSQISMLHAAFLHSFEQYQHLLHRSHLTRT